MASCPALALIVSCALWQVGDLNGAHGFMSILHPALALIVCELYILVCL